MSRIGQHLVVSTNQVLGEILVSLPAVTQQVRSPVKEYTREVAGIIGMFNRPLNFILRGA
ncbi:hypothetical protein D3C85_1645470 [compost metagenome]